MIYAKNKKALFDYEILKKVEAGLVLDGQEVKSIRKGGIKLAGAHVVFHKDEPFLLNAHISKYTYAGPLPNYDPNRTRKLLLKKKEIAYLRAKSQERGLTIVPLSVYTSGRRIKVEIGVAKGKKKHDKREAIKGREAKRQTARALKGNYTD